MSEAVGQDELDVRRLQGCFVWGAEQTFVIGSLKPTLNKRVRLCTKQKNGKA